MLICNHKIPAAMHTPQRSLFCAMAAALISHCSCRGLTFHCIGREAHAAALTFQYSGRGLTFHCIGREAHADALTFQYSGRGAQAAALVSVQRLRRPRRGARLSALAASLRARGAEQASAITGRGAYSCSMQRHRRTRPTLS